MLVKSGNCCLKIVDSRHQQVTVGMHFSYRVLKIASLPEVSEIHHQVVELGSMARVAVLRFFPIHFNFGELISFKKGWP